MSDVTAELSDFSQTLALQVVEQLQEICVKDPDNPKEAEAEAVLNGIMTVCTILEGYLIASLPDARKFNVRAALDALSHAFAKQNPSTPLILPPNPL